MIEKHLTARRGLGSDRRLKSHEGDMSIDSVTQPRPGTKALQLHKGIKKAESALITQMRTGKIGRCAFLFARKLANNSKC